MRILICDDDELITGQLTDYVLQYFSKNQLHSPEIAVYSDGETLLADSKHKDIVFLDVRMPGISGIGIGKQLKHENPNIIIFIVTAFAEYLDEAMRFHVFRYLSKPIDKQRLFRNMRDALTFYHTVNHKIAIETKDGIYTVHTTDIIYVEAQGRDVIIHTTDTDYESVHPIKYWTDTLNMPCFFQTHRSFIVNLEHVTDFNHTLISLYHRQYSAYLTRRKYSQFKAAYLLYLGSIQ